LVDDAGNQVALQGNAELCFATSSDSVSILLFKSNENLVPITHLDWSRRVVLLF
jgi:hypothetical protein